MANLRTTATFVFTDANGQQAQSRFTTFTDDAATVADLVTAVNTIGTAIGAPGHLSNAKVTNVSVEVLILKAQTTPGAGSPPLDAWFPSVADKAQMDFANSLGARARVAIPAPVESVFHSPPADLNVDPANAAVAGLITAVEAYVRDSSLSFVNLYKGGTYVGHRRPRRQGRM